MPREQVNDARSRDVSPKTNPNDVQHVEEARLQAPTGNQHPCAKHQVEHFVHCVAEHSLQVAGTVAKVTEQKRLRRMLERLGREAVAANEGCVIVPLELVHLTAGLAIRLDKSICSCVGPTHSNGLLAKLVSIHVDGGYLAFLHDMVCPSYVPSNLVLDPFSCFLVVDVFVLQK